MEAFTETLILGIIRESISLFTLLVFLFFSYKLIDRILAVNVWQLVERFVRAIEKIADK